MWGRGEVLGVILIPVLLVSILLLPAFSPMTMVTGKVIDDEGNPLQGVTILSSSGIFSAASSVTDQEGRYSMNLRGYGYHTLKAEKDGYWVHMRTCDIDNPDTTIEDFDFKLAKNQEVWVTYASVFCSRDNDQTSAYLGIEILTSPQEVIVRDSKGSGRDLVKSLGGGQKMQSNARSMFEQVLVEISGEYWDTPGEADNCYALRAFNIFNGDRGRDYLNENEVIGGIHQLNPGESLYINSSIGMGNTIPLQLSPSITVNILGVEFTHTFTIELDNAIQNGIILDCEITNHDDVTHEYEVFIDDAGLLHVWQVE